MEGAARDWVSNDKAELDFRDTVQIIVQSLMRTESGNLPSRRLGNLQMENRSREQKRRTVEINCLKKTVYASEGVGLRVVVLFSCGSIEEIATALGGS